MMNIKKLNNFLGMALIAIVITGCVIVINGKSMQGSGNIITREREVEGFNKVHLKGSGKIFLRPGKKQILKIKTDDNIMALIETNVSGDNLTISHGHHHLRPTAFEVYIAVKNLEGVSISGSGDILGECRFLTDTLYAEISGSGEIDLEVETGLLETKISGSGSIQLSGKAEDHTVSISGSGEINAFDMEAKHVTVKVSGSGDCKVAATESLNAKISGSGDVYYKGRPRVNTKISGSGSLKSQ
jgi:hypothetical protein